MASGSRSMGSTRLGANPTKPFLGSMCSIQTHTGSGFSSCIRLLVNRSSHQKNQEHPIIPEPASHRPRFPSRWKMGKRNRLSLFVPNPCIPETRDSRPDLPRKTSFSKRSGVFFYPAARPEPATIGRRKPAIPKKQYRTA